MGGPGRADAVAAASHMVMESAPRVDIVHFTASRPLLDSVSASPSLAPALAADGPVGGNGGLGGVWHEIGGVLKGRFRWVRASFPAVALTTDTSALTCIGNDYGFEAVFERQVQALGREGDCLVCISTSGRSANVLRAAHAGARAGLVTIALTGGDEASPLAACCEHRVAVPGSVTARVQEAHIFIGHAWCSLVEAHFGLA